MLELNPKTDSATDRGEESTLTEIRDHVTAQPGDYFRALGRRQFLIGTNVKLYFDPNARADLLSVDPYGVSVVTVVEREGEHSLLERGLMCAGLVAGWKSEFFFRYPSAGLASRLRGFLQAPVEKLNHKQRVVLVSGSHQFAVWSAAEWLAKRHKIEIWCVNGQIDAATGRIVLSRVGPESYQPDLATAPARVVDVSPAGARPEKPLKWPPVSPEAPGMHPGPSRPAARAPRPPWQPASEAAASISLEESVRHILGPVPDGADQDGFPVVEIPIAGALLQSKTAEGQPAAEFEPAAEESRPSGPGVVELPRPKHEESHGEQPSPAPSEPASAEPHKIKLKRPGPQLVQEPSTEKEPVEEPADSAAETGSEDGVKSSDVAKPAIGPTLVDTMLDGPTFAATRKSRPVGHIAAMVLLTLGLVGAGAAVVSFTQPVADTSVADKPSVEPLETIALQNRTRPMLELGASALIVGAVRDSATGDPIRGARIYYGGQFLVSDEKGEFRYEPREEEKRLLIKAAGYRQTESDILAPGPIRLEPLDVRGFYLSHSHVADPTRREAILDLIRGTGANAVILGVKDVTGQVNLEVEHPLANEIGSTKRAAEVRLANHVANWKASGIYTVALVAMFKDNLVARSKPERALKGIKSGQMVQDADGIAWADPASQEVRDYNIAVATAAAEAGFDEVHFDFLRFSAEGRSLEGGNPAEYARRLETLTGFLADASKALAPYNVYLSSSVFGAVCTMPAAGVIGQRIEEFAEQVDYVAPMLYPSYFSEKLDKLPLRRSYQLVYKNLLTATRRLGGESRKLRPWLQNFPDRANPNVPLGADSIRVQVQAAEEALTNGWMLWDARNRYVNTAEALQVTNDERRTGEASRPEMTGGSLVPLGGLSDSGPSLGVGHLRMVAVLLLAGCFLAVLYGATRAAWLFHRWTRRVSSNPLQARGEVNRTEDWLPRPLLGG